VVYKNQVLQPWATCNPVNHNCTSEGYNVPLSVAFKSLPTMSLPFLTFPTQPPACKLCITWERSPALIIARLLAER
jgi:hypothetical protein